jgi:hypothetical protein
MPPEKVSVVFFQFFFYDGRFGGALVLPRL